MKSLLIVLFLLPIIPVRGQSHFRAEGEKIKTGTVVRTYNFHYILPDSILLSDSVTTYTSADKKIVKETVYSLHNDPAQVRISYKGLNGKDSLILQGRDLMFITRFEYNDSGRLVKRMVTSPSSSHCTDTYTYRHSITTTGRREIRSRQTYCVGNRQNNHLEMYEYNTENRLLKRYDISGKDTLIAHFIYNAQGLPTGVWTSMNRELTAPGENCFNRTERSLTAKNYADHYRLVKQLLRENSAILHSPECHHLSLRYTTPDGHIDIEIRKTLEYRASLQNVTVTVKE